MMIEPGGQADLFGAPPPAVRNSATSRAAAAAVVPRLAPRRTAALAFIKRASGATCDEIEVSMDLLHQTASAMLRTLEKQGYITKTTNTRKTRRGSDATVYAITPAGLSEYNRSIKRG